MKPIDSNISPYLQQPLRTLEQVLQERQRRQRLPATDASGGPRDASADGKAGTPALPPNRVDQKV